jgi:hypothetical protein
MREGLYRLRHLAASLLFSCAQVRSAAPSKELHFIFAFIFSPSRSNAAKNPFRYRTSWRAHSTAPFSASIARLSTKQKRRKSALRLPFASFMA